MTPILPISVPFPQFLVHLTLQYWSNPALEEQPLGTRRVAKEDALAWSFHDKLLLHFGDKRLQKNRLFKIPNTKTFNQKKLASLRIRLHSISPVAAPSFRAKRRRGAAHCGHLKPCCKSCEVVVVVGIARGSRRVAAVPVSAVAVVLWLWWLPSLWL